MFTEEIKIPKERIAVLVGIDGGSKKEIEDCTRCMLDIDSKNGEVMISSNDSLKVYHAKPVIKAIARGFNPRVAELLMDENYTLNIVNIKEFTRGSKKKEMRLKSRIIGKEGKARTMIEDLSDTHICIYGKTIAIIGEIVDCGIAKTAIETLLKGAPHGNVYRKIIEQRRKYSE